ncbi:Peroxiredoxin [Mucilaginibacter pineti]|uniref:Peroxiredoxin n=1 Tax=Mucilaginibacter pineti TaxID=1391627 RepID=A0A1G7AKC1_9SPHI|nr:TlpA disulfide reductase family protein [Mucilaginibacter pineti]SDE15348.1 Peroxiredoxin [Mucilaginibacter pineti]
MNKFNLTPLLILLLLACFFNAQAQISILQKTIDKIQGCKSISYNAVEKGGSPFSDEFFTITSQISFASQANKALQQLYNISFVTTSDKGFNYATHNIFNGTDLLNISLTDKTYRLKKNYTDGNIDNSSVYRLAADLKGYLKNTKHAITQAKDSTVNGIACYHIAIKSIDSAGKAKDSYNNLDVFISQKTFLPAYWKSDQKGVLEKGGMPIGTFKIQWEVTATKYKLNSVTPGTFALNIPAGITEEKPPLALLKKGAPAPNWKLTGTDGKTLSLADLKGKVTLLDITSTGCAACMLSVAPLNNLHAKYKGTDVAVVSINLDDKREDIIKFKDRNKVTYPVYVNGNTIKAAYHVSAIPVFYIINKEGVVSEAYEGFFENFEQQMTVKIDSLR